MAAGFSSNRERAEEFLGSLRADGATATIHQGNVGSWDDCQRVIGEVLEQHGQLDILVNNAGITQDRPVSKMTADDWHKVLRVNLSGSFYLAKPALEHMLERGSGRIVNITSIIGQMGNIGQANYAASKSGIFGLTMTLAREAAFFLAKSGKLEGGRARHHRQRGRAGLHRHGDGGGRPREGARQDPQSDPARAWGSPRRSPASSRSCATTPRRTSPARSGR